MGERQRNREQVECSGLYRECEPFQELLESEYSGEWEMEDIEDEGVVR